MGESNFTGRLLQTPHELLNEEVLVPQFRRESKFLLDYYKIIEMSLLLEYRRMGIIPADNAVDIALKIDGINIALLEAIPQNNGSDISFAIENYVNDNIQGGSNQWHVDRSRNDIQACAQLMFGRDKILDALSSMEQLLTSLICLAEKYMDTPMPGYTHYQFGQVITPGFYFSALIEEILGVLKRLLFIFDDINSCPLGAGAMSGLELPWDREELAKSLGFNRPNPSALSSVSSRTWLPIIASELSVFGTIISRFMTDLLNWTGGEYNFASLPDELAGISSAMPQKKNYPILERVRGKTGHLVSYYFDFMLLQRNTPYTNLVEVSKEGGSNMYAIFETLESINKLLRLVVCNINFNSDKMLAAISTGYFGGFSLANILTLEGNIPTREAQVISGKYILEAMNRELEPSGVDLNLLSDLCRKKGYEISIPSELIHSSFQVEHGLNKKTSGSTNPRQVRDTLDSQRKRLDTYVKEIALNTQQLQDALHDTRFRTLSIIHV